MMTELTHNPQPVTAARLGRNAMLIICVAFVSAFPFLFI